MIPIHTLKGVGPKLAEHLQTLHITTVESLLFHLPFRYEDRSRVFSISTLRVGDRVLIEGTIVSMQIMGARHYLRCTLSDGSQRSMQLVFFHFAKTHQQKLSSAKRIRCFGEVRFGMQGGLEMVHPEYAYVDQIAQNHFLSLTPGLSPVYSTVKGLRQVTLRKLMQQALQLLQTKNILPELLPESLRAHFKTFSLQQALQWIHFPPVDVNSEALLLAQYPAQKRLIFEELLARQLSLKLLRKTVREKKSFQLMQTDAWQKKLRLVLPFQLTASQEKVLSEINQDLLSEKPMMRLLQGDVGSGKTIVACLTALKAIESGFQVALMVPTEILAEQHYYNFEKWLRPLGISLNVLLGKQTSSLQNEIKKKLKCGEIQFIIGTHALFQKSVSFQNLALIIIDEQHRFGVHQRLALLEKSNRDEKIPHQLIMTATPIPRTLSMTAYADLDVSTITELPPGRKPITTILLSNIKRGDVVARVHENCVAKKQAYWICTAIEESDELECEAAEKTVAQLRSQLSDLHIGLVHGRLKPLEKNQVMMQFSRGEIDLLVATTVVEVGVDVPNASLMIIENAERLGLAQLHQLRGRVGRGMQSSYCVLLYQTPLSEIAKKRLHIMRETQDGFKIAEVDLSMRGPGDVLGAQQSGLVAMRVADLMRDATLLPLVDAASCALFESHADTIPLLVDRWVGSAQRYSTVF